MNKKGLLFNIIVLFLAFIILIVCLFALYYIYTNTPRSPVNLEVDIPKTDTIAVNSSPVLQFHQNMKFNHNNISYFIYPDCDSKKKQRMRDAFDYITNIVGDISFQETMSDADIEVICSDTNKDKTESDKDYFIAGEGGAREIIQTGKYNIITNGTILLYKYPENYKECPTPNIEIHELIHVFGFDHSNDKMSLMNPYLVSCDQKLDESIIKELTRLYSIDNLPDVYFEEVMAIKRGRYIDFNLTIKNSGDIDAKNVSFSVIEDGNEIEKQYVGDIRYGAGVYLKVESLKLDSMSPKKILFSLDNNNLIKESDKSNNLAEIKFKSE